MESGTILVIGFFVGAVAIIFTVSRIMNKKGGGAAVEDKKEEVPELTARFFMGQYKSGLPGFQGPAPIVFCGVTEDYFLLCKGTKGAEIGRIPRTAIRQVNLRKQDNKNHFLTIEWTDAAGSNHSSEFQYIDKIAEEQATKAAETFKQWMQKESAGREACCNVAAPA